MSEGEELPARGFSTILRAARTEEAIVSEAVRRNHLEPRILVLVMSRITDVEQILGKTPYRFGWMKALDLVLDVSSLNPGVPIPDSSAWLIGFARSALAKLDNAAQLEHLAGCVASNLLRVVAIGDSEIELVVPRGSGAEGLERQSFQSLATGISSAILEIEARISQASESIASHVGVSYDKFITYPTSDPDAEHLFREWADAFAATKWGADTFSENVQFGGLEYGAYCEAALNIVASARKHIQYSDVALGKYPFLNPYNLATVPVDIDVLVSDFCRELHCSPHHARLVVEVFTKNPKRHQMLAAPPFVRLGHNAVLRSIRGAFDDIFVYMLESLRRLHRTDWDSAVEQREDIFRQQIAEQLIGHGIVCLKKSRIISFDNIKTDIDVISLDPREGLLALFQLKWMEPFGYSLQQRRSRQRNFTEAVNLWTEKVDRWIASCGTPQEAARKLGFARHQYETVREIRIFAIGRWFSLFSNGVSPDPRCAWLNWPRFLKSLDDLRAFSPDRSTSALEWLWRDAKNYEWFNSSFDVASLHETFTAGSLKIVLTGES